jgi:MSHA biogenesis protein MshI
VDVVVARRKTVAARVAQLTHAGLEVAAIDIPELAQREVSDRLDVDGGHALLALDARQGLLTVFRDGEHYLARALDIGRTTLTERPADASNDLVLEVQRSFDYFESALSQPPLGWIYVYPGTAETAGRSKERSMAATSTTTATRLNGK